MREFGIRKEIETPQGPEFITISESYSETSGLREIRIRENDNAQEYLRLVKNNDKISGGIFTRPDSRFANRKKTSLLGLSDAQRILEKIRPLQPETPVPTSESAPTAEKTAV